ncbi:glycosyltransferase family 4 protein [Micromonospora chaiyaphumensis]|uniref:Glycosyltransferase involved in cell wall bisynthesis n=1 Tax=Micromonospora chaiyaphumensis TaxID=307119 RepID=A0A1C4X6B4_9ACTN|nr:glycosyltransferase family 4 protein [Micromonospora chaiyaphumensis]SCF04006.1 Glycosyltransferase involved in cell wall bisynthesis [Micromonospora chaiyaphumensis]
MDTQHRRRRVVVLNQYAQPLSRAGGTRHVELFSRLRGWDWSIVAASWDHFSHSDLAADDPHFVTVPVTRYTGNDHRRVLSWLTYARNACRAVLRGPRPDVVYASSPHLLTPVAGWLAARLRRSRFVLEVRDLWPEAMVSTGFLRRNSPTHRLLRALERWLYRRADRIVIVAAGWRAYFAAAGVPDAKLEWISNGAEPEDFDLRPDRYQPLRRRVPVRGRLLVFAGSHGAINGLHRLLDAVAEVPEHTFVLIGDGLEKPELVARAAAEGLTNVHFLDRVPKQELRGILGDADIGIHVLAHSPVYDLGASPNKLYDYLAAGLPVVNNCPGEPEDILRAADSGLTVPTADLATGLRELAALEPEKLAAMGRRGRRYVEENRSRTVMAAKLQRLLDGLVEEIPPVRP